MSEQQLLSDWATQISWINWSPVSPTTTINNKAQSEMGDVCSFKPKGYGQDT